MGQAFVVSVALLALIIPAATESAPRKPTCFGKAATIVVRGPTGSGTARNDVIVVKHAGGAKVNGGRGNDRICGGRGADTLISGKGRDRVRGAHGDDRLVARDEGTLLGEEGEDSFETGGGDVTTDAEFGELVNGVRKWVDATPKATTLVVPPADVVSVIGDPNVGQQLELSAAVAEPSVGAPLVVAASVQAPAGVLGVVTAVEPGAVSGFVVDVEPATLDDAYDHFEIGLDARLADLDPYPNGGGWWNFGSVEADDFTCVGDDPEHLTAGVDLRPLDVDFSFDLESESIGYRLTGNPTVTLDGDVDDDSCEAAPPHDVEVAIGGPVTMTLQPAIKVSTSEEMNAGFSWSPGVDVGFGHDASTDQVFRELDPGPSELDLDASDEAQVSFGGSVDVQVGGRAAVAGDFGPDISAETDVDGGEDCLGADGAVSSSLSPDTAALISGWTIPAPGAGASTPEDLFEHCVPAGPHGTVASPGLSFGWGHACAIGSDGSATCWGDDSKDQANPQAGEFTQISAGHGRTCAVKSDQDLACWGEGNGIFFGSDPTPPAGDFVQVTVGRVHACALRPDGSAACWHNSEGLEEAYLTGRYTQITAGWHDTCALRIHGTVDCGATKPAVDDSYFGGTFGQISVGKGDLGSSPTNIGEHVCGVRMDGSVSCWGFDEDTIPVWGPTTKGVGRATPPAGAFTEVTAGGFHTCGIRSDGSVSCWGEDRNDQATPPAGTFTELSAGYQGTCGRLTSGDVTCWGAGFDPASD